MKKLLSLILMSSMALPGYAGTIDQHAVYVQNTETSDAFSLNVVTTRTEYRTETVVSTCYRQEVVGYERVCSRSNGVLGDILLSNRDIPRPPRPPRPPEPRPPRPPEPRPPRPPEPRPPAPRPPVCYDRPIYRDVAYSCMRTITVPYEVVDRQYTANVNARITPAPYTRPANGQCPIVFRMERNNVYPINQCPQYIATSRSQVNQNGNILYYNFDITLHDAEKILAPLRGGLGNMHMEGSELVFNTGALSNSSYVLKLYVERKRLLQNDVVLINRPLNANEYTYIPSNDMLGNVRIDLNRLVGGFENDKKNLIRVSLDLNLNIGPILQGSNVPSLHQENSITIND